MIAVIDYGIGNLLSIKNMFKRAGTNDVIITSNVDEIRAADKLLLPGVGHFDYGMQKLKASGCLDILERKVLEEKTPILGICLGAQMLTKGSEEGSEKGLGWIDAETLKFNFDEETKLPVPHMGWSAITYKKHPLFTNMHPNPRFYFVHSYYMKPAGDENLLCEATYGITFAAGIQKDNILGVQFHPEKSHKFGLRLLETFARI